MLDVVYVVREDIKNEQLRYSLRSLENLPHRQVFICGFKPDWVDNVIYLPRPQEGLSDLENSNANLLLALRDERLSDDFILMMDDVFIMEPILEVPAMHQGSLKERIDQYMAGNRMAQAYSLIKTNQFLGSGDLLSYELHMPFVMNKHKALKMFEDKMLVAVRPRTLYGNLYATKGEKVDDVKGSTEGRFISSGDFDSATGRAVRARFPNRGDYERLDLAREYAGVPTAEWEDSARDQRDSTGSLFERRSRVDRRDS